MKSLGLKFKGREAQVVEHVKWFGQNDAMDKYDVHDTVAMENWLYEQTRDHNFGRHPVFRSTNSNDIIAAVFKEFLNTLHEAQNKLAEKDAEIERLRTELEYRKACSSSILKPIAQEVMLTCSETKQIFNGRKPIIEARNDNELRRIGAACRGEPVGARP